MASNGETDLSFPKPSDQPKAEPDPETSAQTMKEPGSDDDHDLSSPDEDMTRTKRKIPSHLDTSGDLAERLKQNTASFGTPFPGSNIAPDNYGQNYTTPGARKAYFQESYSLDSGRRMEQEVQRLGQEVQHFHEMWRHSHQRLEQAEIEREGYKGELHNLREMVVGLSRNSGKDRSQTFPPGIISKPQKYDGSDDLDVYLETFEEMGEMFGWTEKQKAFCFKNRMKGNASLLVKGAAEKSYASYVKALRSGLYDTKDHYRQLLQARKQAPDETLAKLSLELQQLGDQAFGTSSNETKALALRDAFINAIADPQVRSKVRDVNPETLKDAEAAAKRLAFNLSLESGQPNKPKVQVAKAVKKEDELSEVEMARRIDNLTEKVSQMETPKKKGRNQSGKQRRNQSPSRGKGKNANRKPSFDENGVPLCYHCGYPGHFAQYCPNKTNPGGPEQRGYYQQGYNQPVYTPYSQEGSQVWTPNPAGPSGNRQGQFPLTPRSLPPQ
jgi:hypothetical protein